MYVLHILQLQFSPVQYLIRFLKIESVLACFTAFGKVDQSLFPRKDIVSIPKAVVCTFGSCESVTLSQIVTSIPLNENIQVDFRPDFVFINFCHRQLKISYVDGYQITLLKKRLKICQGTSTSEETTTSMDKRKQSHQTTYQVLSQNINCLFHHKNITVLFIPKLYFHTTKIKNINYFKMNNTNYEQ